MGMFDYIKINVNDLPLPEGFDKTKFTGEFQTKCLGQTLTNYKIENKKLYETVIDREFIKDPSHFLGGYMREISRNVKFCGNRSGEIIFYDYIQNYDDKNDASIDFKALIVDGFLKRVELVEFKKWDNSRRKEGMRELEESIKREDILSKKFYYPVIEKYRKIRLQVRNFLGNSLLTIGNGFNRAGMWVYKKL